MCVCAGQRHRKISEGPGCASGKGSHRNVVALSPCAGAACLWEAKIICGLLGGAAGSDLVWVQTGSVLSVPKPLLLKGRELLLRGSGRLETLGCELPFVWYSSVSELIRCSTLKLAFWQMVGDEEHCHTVVPSYTLSLM